MSDKTSGNSKLPIGAELLPELERPFDVDVDLAVSLASLGASPVLVRAIGGDEALLQADQLPHVPDGS
jgi:hypothetical protein